MCKPRETPDTVVDEPEQENVTADLGKLLTGFAIAAVVVIVAGAVVAHTTAQIAEATGMNQTVAGGLLSGIATSLPELVTTLAAVKRGALTLAVGDIVGGNFSTCCSSLPPTCSSSKVLFTTPRVSATGRSFSRRWQSC